MKALKYVSVGLTAALIGAFVMFAIWDQLSRAEYVAVSSMAWFPAAAVAWGGICFVGCLYYYRVPSARRTTPSKKVRSTRSGAKPR